MTLDDLLPQLDGVRPRGSGRWAAKCQAHADKNPSLSISEGDKGILLKCWGGCTLDEICKALGIAQRDLFFDAALPRGHNPPTRPARIDRRALAFTYELAALDLRLRAEKIIRVGNGLDLTTMTDDELDQALAHVAQAHADCDRAELFEGVADDLRMKEFLERDHAQQTRVA